MPIIEYGTTKVFFFWLVFPYHKNMLFMTTPPVIRIRGEQYFAISGDWHLIKAEASLIYRLVTRLLLEFLSP